MEICHRIGKLLLFLEAEKQQSKHSSPRTESEKCSLNTDIQSSTGLAQGCDTAATEGALSADGNVIGVVPRGLKSLQGHTKKLAEKIFAAGGTVFSEYPDDLAKIFNRHYLRRDAIITGLSEKTIIIAAEERSGSSATANHAVRQGREVLITRHVKAKIEGATLVENLGELKDALGMDREGLKIGGDTS